MQFAAQLGATASSLSNFDALPATARLRTRTVCDLLACSRTTLWRKVQSGEIAAPIREAANVVRWRVSDVRAHLASAGKLS